MFKANTICIKTEEKLVFDVAIVDRGNHIVKGYVESKIRGSAPVRDDQKIQDVRNGCTTLVFNIYSFAVSQQLVMSPQLKNDSIYIYPLQALKGVLKLTFWHVLVAQLAFNKQRMMQEDVIVSVMK